MAELRNSTPLIALDAIVIDTETTGLDPRKARIVEIAAVRLDSSQLDEREPFRSLINPQEPIPAAVTDIHGIDDSAVAAAPVFAKAWPEFSDYLGDFDSRRSYHRVRYRDAGPGVRAGRREVAATSDTVHAAAVAGGRACAGRLFPGKRRGLARGRDFRPAFGARRCEGDGQDIHRIGAQATRTGHPNARRGDAGLPRCRQRRRWRLSGEPGRDGECCRCAASHNSGAGGQLRLPPPRRRHHEHAGLVGRGRYDECRGPRHDDAIAGLLGLRPLHRSRTCHASRAHRHRHRARPAACDQHARRGRPRIAGRAIHEPSAGDRARRCIRPSRDRPDEPPWRPSSRRDGRCRPCGRRAVGAKSPEAAGSRQRGAGG